MWGIKYIPLIDTVLLTGHTGLLLCGIHEPVTVALSAFLLVALLILLSIRFAFCSLHRALIIFMAVVTTCIVLQKYNIFGELLQPARLIVFGCGVYLIGRAIAKYINNDCEQ